MKRTITVFLFLGLLGCAKKDKGFPLFLLPLLNGASSLANPSTSGGGSLAVVPLGAESQDTGATNPIPTTTQTPETQVQVNLEILPESNATGLCSSNGGLLLRYERGTEKTCGISNLSSGCATQALDTNSQPLLLDPRSYVGILLPRGLTVPNIAFPPNSQSLVYCFHRRAPSSALAVNMYAFRNRSGGSIPNNCPGTMEGEFCNDTLPLLVPTRFQIPREFPLVTEAGQTGNAGGHWLELKYRNENDKYVTCIYGGNGFGGPAGYTPNSYISGNPQAQYRKGYCLVCSVGYCNYNKGGGTGPFTGADAFDHEYLITTVEGTAVTAKTEIYLSVRNGQGASKHTVSWTIQGFEPLESTLATLPIDAFLLGALEENVFWIALAFIFLGLVSGYFWKKRSFQRT